jgi:hypothetical protein
MLGEAGHEVSYDHMAHFVAESADDVVVFHRRFVYNHLDISGRAEGSLALCVKPKTDPGESAFSAGQEEERGTVGARQGTRTRA